MFYPGFESMKEIVIPYDKVVFASKAGLHPANHFATIEDSSDIFRIIDEGLHKTGDFIILTIFRNNETMIIKLKLEGNKNNWWTF